MAKPQDSVVMLLRQRGDVVCQLPACGAACNAAGKAVIQR